MLKDANTGRGNYPAARLSVSAEELKAGLKGIKGIKRPNAKYVSQAYKTGVKKREEGNE